MNFKHSKENTKYYREHPAKMSLAIFDGETRSAENEWTFRA